MVAVRLGASESESAYGRTVPGDRRRAKYLPGRVFRVGHAPPGRSICSLTAGVTAASLSHVIVTNWSREEHESVRLTPGPTVTEGKCWHSELEHCCRLCSLHSTQAGWPLCQGRVAPCAKRQHDSYPTVTTRDRRAVTVLMSSGPDALPDVAGLPGCSRGWPGLDTDNT